jgi:phosphoheptose isomerase
MNKIREIIEASIAVKQQILEDEKLMQTVNSIADLMVKALKNSTGSIFAAMAEVQLMHNTGG